MLHAAISEAFSTFFGVFSGFDSIIDVLDVLLVTMLFYSVIIQLRRTQSVQILKGAFIAIVAYAIVSLLKMQASKMIFDQIVSNIVLIFIVVFNTEIRQVLGRLGRANWRTVFLINSAERNSVMSDAINATVRACQSMSEDRIGSLIVFQRNTNLGDLEKSGVYIDSKTTTEMLCSIFFPNAALHDGAIIIKDGRIIAARCIVPLKNDHTVTEKVGTRHRAAMEVSRGGDAIAVVTSEETGIISIAIEGTLVRNITDAELRERLNELLLPDDESDNGFVRWVKRFFTGGGSGR
ncbi:MAG: diadenylate cyclase CdaA [Clostridiales bacterium]|nr:diadenylate cyclase CdaA [Clostridiales bacterium]